MQKRQKRTLEKSVQFYYYNNSNLLLASANSTAASLLTAVFDQSNWPNSRVLEVVSV